MAVLIQMTDIICCQERIGFYLTAYGDELNAEMYETLGVTPAQIEEIRASLGDMVADAEGVLTA